MAKIVAERRLCWASKGDQSKSEFVIRVGTPYVVEPNSVDFEVSEGTGACNVEFDGFPEDVHETLYGADTIQALQLAVDIDPLLKRFSARYDFYFPTGEPYFE